MAKPVTIDKIRIALNKYIEGDYIILERKDVIGDKVVYDEQLKPTITKVKTGTITHSVDINVFADLYISVLENVLVPNGNKLPAMRNKVFKDAVDNIIDKGYNKFIQQWIDEGITL